MSDLNSRSLEVFKELVDAYIETGEPVGSRTLSKRLCDKLKDSVSPATIRNIMSDLEDAGLLYAPHVSAGRLPTDSGLKFFVNGMLKVGNLTNKEKEEIKKQFNVSNNNVDDILENASKMLSGLSRCASIMKTIKTDSVLHHIEIVFLAPKKALIVLISVDGFVENRLAEIPENVTRETLELASKYLNAYLTEKTLSEVKNIVLRELKDQKSQIDKLVAKVVEAGLLALPEGDSSNLIINGQSNLLESITEIKELEHIKQLFDQFENKRAFSKILDASIEADGVQIFIGSENSLFNTSGCSLIVSPYHNSSKEIVGVIGVIGPIRMNYGKIIPLVDYTAKLVSKVMGPK